MSNTVQVKGYIFDGTIEEAMPLFKVVGSVYPINERAYYVNSNVQCQLVSVECLDGDFYADSETAEKVCRVVERTFTLGLTDFSKEESWEEIWG